jgi:hypothetical protein
MQKVTLKEFALMAKDDKALTERIVQAVKPNGGRPVQNHSLILQKKWG